MSYKVSYLTIALVDSTPLLPLSRDRFTTQCFQCKVAVWYACNTSLHSTSVNGPSHIDRLRYEPWLQALPRLQRGVHVTRVALTNLQCLVHPFLHPQWVSLEYICCASGNNKINSNYGFWYCAGSITWWYCALQQWMKLNNSLINTNYIIRGNSVRTGFHPFSSFPNPNQRDLAVPVWEKSAFLQMCPAW